ncbi:hypothetical protein IC575_005067 [Cucumis melo]
MLRCRILANVAISDENAAAENLSDDRNRFTAIINPDEMHALYTTPVLPRPMTFAGVKHLITSEIDRSSFWYSVTSQPEPSSKSLSKAVSGSSPRDPLKHLRHECLSLRMI